MKPPASVLEPVKAVGSLWFESWILADTSWKSSVPVIFRRSLCHRTRKRRELRPGLSDNQNCCKLDNNGGRSVDAIFKLELNNVPSLEKSSFSPPDWGRNLLCGRYILKSVFLHFSVSLSLFQDTAASQKTLFANLWPPLTHTDCHAGGLTLLPVCFPWASP